MRIQITALVAALAIAPIAVPASAFAKDQRPAQTGKAYGAESLERKSVEKKSRVPGTPESAERARQPGKVIFF